MKDACLALGFGIVLIVVLLFVTEGALRFLPQGVLPEAAREAPPLVEPDQANIVFQKNGFRGKRPCDTCPDSTVRILTMGGSSTMGIPMLFAGRTYAAQLQRLLDERRPGEHYEVLNGGVGGFGITQVYSSLKEELLKYKPDIVTISCWFNDTAPSPGWYSIPGKSDWEGYLETRRLAKIAQNPLVRFLRSTRVYAALRHFLLETRSQFLARSTRAKQKGRPRMTPEEFQAALEEILLLAKEHKFLPVLLTEAKNRTDVWEYEHKKNPYLRVLSDFSKKHHLPFVDSLSSLSRYRDQWLFYDFIHPNPAGHEVIAEAVYDELFTSAPRSKLQKFWQERGVDVSKPEAVQKVHLQLDPELHPGSDLVLEARTPYQTEGVSRLVVYGDGVSRRDFEGLNSSFSQFRLPLSSVQDPPPILDLFLEVEPHPSKSQSFPIGSSGRASPVPISLKSGGKDYGWTVEVKVSGVRQDQNYRGYNAVVIGGATGKVLHSTVFDIYGNPKENQRLSHFLSSLNQFNEGAVSPIVVLAVKTDGGMNVEKDKLVPALRLIGGTGEIPQAFHSFALIGSPGIPPGSGIEISGPRLITHALGDKNSGGENLLQVRLSSANGSVTAFSGGVSFTQSSGRVLE